MTFESLQLAEPIVKALEQKGYTEPSPIQQQAIPAILEGRDLLASAQTGTGKTAAFTLPMLQNLIHGKTSKQPRALILTPTRELAAQIFDNVKYYSKHLSLRSCVIFGGVNQNPQAAQLKSGVDVLIATPGRLLDLYQQKLLSLSSIEILVLDEADRMLDMGFVNDIKKIIALVPKKRQNLLFSATYSKEIKALAEGFLQDPLFVQVSPQNSTVEAIEQKVYNVSKAQKPQLLVKLIREGNWKQVLVFTRTKHRANQLSRKLESSGIKAAAIHGDKSQGARTKALEGFKKGSLDVLVATDIAARGLDIPLLPFVVNFEIPNIPQDYVHRIGRTGRAGASGISVSLVSSDENSYLLDIEKLIGQKIPSEILEGFEPDPSDAVEAKIKQKQGRGPRPQSKAKQGKPQNNSRPKR
ncbi:MAG: ATP-dependent RNA helicase RhlE [Flavobacteriaceae bacterium]|nr:MAG: ATP-dependent RNA helicase RhlE [Flavobacteriaceae bacterium]